MAQSFRCYLVRKSDAGQVSARVEQCTTDDLPPGDVLIRVAYSSLNYKDALAATGHPGVVRRFPHVPGIDAAGVVDQSKAREFKSGDEVLVTGYELGAGTWGGFAEFVRVPAEWVVPLPKGLTLHDSMVYGTAGFTAAQSLEALVRNEITPERGEVLVTGASGGVGSMAVALLAKAGFKVVAVSGKPAAREMLASLGAARVIGREELDEKSDQPLLKARWAAAIDCVGGKTLATILRSTDKRGCVAACGLVGGTELPLNVYPFILRGVTLAGIDSAWCPMERRRQIWQRLAGEWRIVNTGKASGTPADLSSMGRTIDLDELDRYVPEILAGQTMGRIVVQLSPSPSGRGSG